MKVYVIDLHCYLPAVTLLCGLSPVAGLFFSDFFLTRKKSHLCLMRFISNMFTGRPSRFPSKLVGIWCSPYTYRFSYYRPRRLWLKPSRLTQNDRLHQHNIGVKTNHDSLWKPKWKRWARIPFLSDDMLWREVGENRPKQHILISRANILLFYILYGDPCNLSSKSAKLWVIWMKD